ncbi:MAG: AAA family ATPase, partial [Thermonemataceae bacterium]
MGKKNEIEHFVKLFLKKMRNKVATLDVSQANAPASLNFSAYQQHLLGQFSGLQQEIVLVALLPYLYPETFSHIVEKEMAHGGFIATLGGQKNASTKRFVPTLQTVFFLLCQNDLAQRKAVIKALLPDRGLIKKNVIAPLDNYLDPEESLLVTREFLHEFLLETPYQPQYSRDFPAQLLTCEHNWEDLLVFNETKEEINHVLDWMRSYKQMRQHKALARDIKGYRVLFKGESGTGKTLTARLISKELGVPAYRIDLSKIVSKYVGETEKNLEKIFNL